MKLKDFTVITTLVFDSLMTEVMKAPQLKIKDEKVIQEILENGLYHFTSSEAADKIIESGYIKPTRGMINTHTVGKKVFMFSGVPDFDLYRKNLSKDMNPLVAGNVEFSAVKMNVNEEQLNKYRRRPQDGAISYSGKCNIEDKDVKKVDFVLDLDENKNYVIREKTEEEIETGYIPSDELTQKQQEDKTSRFKEDINQHLLDRKYTYESIRNTLNNIKERIQGMFNKNKTLPKAEQEGNEQEEQERQDTQTVVKSEDNTGITSLLNEHVKDNYELPIVKEEIETNDKKEMTN